MECFDYVVVGGGTAGCILANRLSASGKHRVLLLEAGSEPRNLWISVPAGFSKLLTNNKYNWCFSTTPEANTYHRKIAVPRGRGLGGSSLINGMIYAWGQPEDYDAWESAGASGWGFRDVEPYFRKMETFMSGGTGRGQQGPMNIERVHERFPVSSAFIQAAKEDGHPVNCDYNSGSQNGFGYYQTTQKNGRRWSVVDGYLNPARQRQNLTVLTSAQVLELNFLGTRCNGVTYMKSNRAVSVQAGLEVIMAAGAVQTPQILELSGIGDPELLTKYNIPVRHALSNVGENYIDHFATRMSWRVKNTVTLNEMARGWRLIRAVGEYISRRTGILTLGTGLVHGFVKTSPDLKTPDIQYFFVHASYANAAERVLDREPGMTIGVTQLRPQSVGSIHIQSSDVNVAPSIKPNFLSAAVDRQCLTEGMKIARRIINQPAMSDYVSHEMCPGKHVTADQDWLEFACREGQTIYHPVGTCRMGSDAEAVVDPQLRVNGLQGLRIADASVMPLIVSGNTQAAVMMIAEKAADLILSGSECCSV
nr:GMC family oxidoreductase N-terminal domain-containing protein [Aliamphritea hakodatensis]